MQVLMPVSNQHIPYHYTLPIFSHRLHSAISQHRSLLISSYPALFIFIMNLLHFLIVCSYTILPTRATCHFPNGTAKASRAERPCNDSPGVQSMCCNLRSCRGDGLCIPYDNGHLWRGSCTDPTWKDDACLQLCVEGLSKYNFSLLGTEMGRWSIR